MCGVLNTGALCDPKVARAFLYIRSHEVRPFGLAGVLVMAV